MKVTMIALSLLVGGSRAFLPTSKSSSFPRLNKTFVRLASTITSTDNTAAVNKSEDTKIVGQRTRFAPSPTGSLHVGGARTALYNWLLAQQGRDEKNNASAFVLRVEDTDLARSTKESEVSVINDLKWLGLNWDEGPADETDAPNGGAYGPYRQSERGELYVKIAEELMAKGLAYKCFCTEEELEEMKAAQESAGELVRYNGKWRDASPEEVQAKLDEGAPYVVRFKVPDNCRVVIQDAVRGQVSWDASATLGDYILLRSSGVPVYNFCVAVDDASMKVTTVIRAEEHLTNTLRQVLILDALGFPRPQYAHCSLILGSDRQKLSKRHGATSVTQFAEEGFLPEAMVNYLSLLGWNDGTDNEIFTVDELIELFSVDRVVSSPAMFDMDKLRWVNSQHLKNYDITQLRPMVFDLFERKRFFSAECTDAKAKEEFAIMCTALAKEFMETLVDPINNAIDVLDYQLPESYNELSYEWKEIIDTGYFYKLGQSVVADYEASSFPVLENGAWNDVFESAFGEHSSSDNNSFVSDYKKYMKTLSKAHSVKGKNLFHPIRLALTGAVSGQDVSLQLALLQSASNNNLTNSDTVRVVPLQKRIERLKQFLETVPESVREPVNGDVNQDSSKSQDNSAQQAARATTTNELSLTNTNTVDPFTTYEGPPITSLDIRVGEIVKMWNHEEADRLYCELVDVGEDEPRQIASGLREFYDNPQDLIGKKVLVLCNLKARNLVGFPSHGMLLCASDQDHSQVRLISPPADAVNGDKITFNVPLDNSDNEPWAENKIGKKKVLEKVLPHLTTDEYGVPNFFGRPFMTQAGVCISIIPDGTVG